MDDPGAAGNGCDASTEPQEPRAYNYVFRTLTVDQGTGGMAPSPWTHNHGVTGFNLDGRYSAPAAAMPADCTHGDFFSTLDPDQNMGTCATGAARGGSACNGGVDNQLPDLADMVSGFGADLRAEFRDQLRQGRLALLVRITDVNGTPGPCFNDSSVHVSVYATGRPMFADCAESGAPGQPYAIDSVSRETTFTGRIVNGRLVVEPPAPSSRANLMLNLSVRGMPFPLPLLQTQLRMNMTPDTGTGGNLGGYVTLRDLATSIHQLYPAGVPRKTVQSFHASLVDIQLPTGDPMGCTAPNGAVGVGLGFTAVRATILPARVAGPQPGMCGS